MTTKQPGYTIVLHRDGETSSRQIRVPLWAMRLAGGSAITLGVLLLVALIAYGPVYRLASRVPRLQNEVARLESENARIRDLVSALDSAEYQYARVRQMLGADAGTNASAAVPPAITAPPVIVTGMNAAAAAGPSVPTRWPLDEPGYITRGILKSGGEESHQGLDIAVRVGSVVRATGGGKVTRAGADPDYGQFVSIAHADGYESRYGHLSRLLVREGASVQAGTVIGLSGNSGRSSAPHLHFEILKGGSNIDPLSMVKEVQ